MPSMHHLFGRPAPRPHGQLGFQRAKEDTFHMKSVGLIFTQNLQIHKPLGGKIVQCHGFSFTVIRTKIWSTTQAGQVDDAIPRSRRFSLARTDTAQAVDYNQLQICPSRAVIGFLQEIQLSIAALDPMTLRNFALNSRPFLFFRLSAQLRLSARDICLHVDGGDPGGHEPGQGTPRPQGKRMGRV